MSYKELDIKVEMPNRGNAYSISCYVSGYETALEDPELQSFKLETIQWKTYCDEMNDDVHHTMYDQWMCGHDLLDMLEQVHKLVETMSS